MTTTPIKATHKFKRQAKPCVVCGKETRAYNRDTGKPVCSKECNVKHVRANIRTVAAKQKRGGVYLPPRRGLGKPLKEKKHT